MRVPVRAASVLALALTAATMSVSTSATAATSRIVVYDGAKITVPTSWPVYSLSDDPTRCVRFDRHAVYLGHPGANQDCPAHLVGRTTALLVEPYDSTAAVGAGGGETQAVTSNGRALITASYGAGGATAAAAVLRPTPTRAAAPTPKAAPKTAPNSAAAPQTVRPAAISGAGYGFDTCAAPSADTMKAWITDPKALYRSAAIYVGGANRTCPDGNLSASWVKTVRSYGYTFMPMYVGRQAPCSGIGLTMSSNPTLASTNGHDAAVDAIHAMQRLGFGAHSPVYLDIEQYTGDATCTRAVLRFVDAWVHRLHLSGYVAGVYESDSNIGDMMTAHHTSGFYLPDALWMGHWNGKASVYGDPVLPDNYWAPHKRVHQYRGPHRQVYGGVAMDIDTDYLDGPVG